MFSANYDGIGSGYSINEVDADGIGKTRIRVDSTGFSEDAQLAERATRFLLLALNMEGGIDHALGFLRAETVRQRG